MSEVTLRPWKREDAQQLAALGNSRNVWLNLRDGFPHPYTVMDAMQWIGLHADEQHVLHFCILYHGKVAGSIGIVPKEDVYRKSVELGYFIGEPFWGKGIATKAIGFVIDYIEQNFDIVRIFAEVFEHNKASMNALRKNGFYLEGIRKQAVIKNGVVMDDYVWVKLVKTK